MASSQGTEQLVKKCAALLVGAIQRKLPLIDAKVKELIGKKLDELKALPETTQETMRIHYQDIVREFETRFNGLLDGTSSVSGDYEDALHGGARIANLFEYSFQVKKEEMRYHYLSRTISRACFIIRRTIIQYSSCSFLCLLAFIHILFLLY